MAEDRQRIDKWLWFARMAKTRPVAQALAEGGKVRINGRKIDAAAKDVRIGDVLTLALPGGVRVLKVLGFAPRRGSFPEARKLYDDLAPPPGPDVEAGEGEAEAPEAPEPSEAREPSEAAPSSEAPPPAAPAPARGRPSAPAAPRPVRGEGRPTKRDRRRLDRLGED